MYIYINEKLTIEIHQKAGEWLNTNQKKDNQVVYHQHVFHLI